MKKRFGSGCVKRTFNVPNGGIKLWMRNDMPVKPSGANIKFKNLNTSAEGYAFGGSQNSASGWTVVAIDKKVIGDGVVSFPMGFGSNTGLYTDLSSVKIVNACIKY